MAAPRRLTKNEKRRSKKKEAEPQNGNKLEASSAGGKQQSNGDAFNGIEIEYVSADYEHDLGIDSGILDQFRSIFEKFAKPEELVSDVVAPSETSESNSLVKTAAESKASAEETAEQQKISKRKKKLLSRLSVAELKQLVPRPDVVEAHDVTSSDPRLLVTLKSYRCSVPVPRHWCHIRKYLTGKVGMEKPPFQLPEFIAETGIAKIRDAVMEQEAAKKSKAKARERIRPKMGKIDIDYQVLHDAFFKYQTKPKLTGHGDLYYEGKEYEVSMKEMKPGHMSKELVAALGIADGGPPPWLINMQRYGPPPSYPSMKIPGLSAPLPPGASYGYQPGGWGKPPVDEYNRPLYGDVFGVAEEEGTAGTEPAVDKAFRWGQLQAPEYAPDDEDEDEEGDSEGDEDGQQGYDPSGAETPSTLDGARSVASSHISGLETPDTVDLRKRAGMETPDSTYTSVAAASSGRELYHVVQERQNAGAAAGQMFGSDRLYVLPNGGGGGNVGAGVGIGGEHYNSNLGQRVHDGGAGGAGGAEEEDGDEDRAGAAQRKKRKLDAVGSKLKEFKF